MRFRIVVKRNQCARNLTLDPSLRLKQGKPISLVTLIGRRRIRIQSKSIICQDIFLGCTRIRLLSGEIQTHHRDHDDRNNHEGEIFFHTGLYNDDECIINLYGSKDKQKGGVTTKGDRVRCFHQSASRDHNPSQPRPATRIRLPARSARTKPLHG